ncbi:MAG: hypothetical protein QOE93_2111 [Actinomycetota bacterium]|jgi:uncharacterized protein YabN with tetrapyrrole methylase and pyrophosphatase domain|nr:hypothetical protein [Actinomycetota bacterium]
MGTVVVVGTGIALSHITREAEGAIRSAEVVFYAVGDPVTTNWITRIHPSTQSLLGHYEEGRDRAETYAAMVEQVLATVRAGRHVCVALYGHPGVFAYPGHEIVRRAQAEGFLAEMLPAVSALDCLFSDLQLDPAVAGCQMYDATYFLLRSLGIDTSVPLILWQVALVGIAAFEANPTPDLVPLQTLLAQLYSPTHQVIVYEASAYPGLRPSTQTMAIGDLGQARLSLSSTLYIPASPATQFVL